MLLIPILCTHRNLYDLLFDSSRLPIPLPLPLTLSLRKLTLEMPLYWIGGFCSGLSLFVEAERRRGELAMYIMLKALESPWVAVNGKDNPSARRRVLGKAAFVAAAMGMVMVSPLLADVLKWEAKIFMDHNPHSTYQMIRSIYQVWCGAFCISSSDPISLWQIIQFCI